MSLPEVTFADVIYSTSGERRGDVSLCFSADSPEAAARAVEALSTLRGVRVEQDKENNTFDVVHTVPVTPGQSRTDWQYMRQTARQMMDVCSEKVTCHINLEAVPEIAKMQDESWMATVVLRQRRPAGDPPSGETEYLVSCVVDDQLDKMPELEQMGFEPSQLDREEDAMGMYQKATLRLNRAERHPGKSTAEVDARDSTERMREHLGLGVGM